MQKIELQSYNFKPAWQPPHSTNLNARSEKKTSTFLLINNGISRCELGIWGMIQSSSKI